MKYTIAILLIAACAHAEDVLPPRYNFDRYAKMMDHSPFAIKTAVAGSAAAVSFAKDLYVANAAHTPDGDLVTLESVSDRSLKIYVNSAEPKDGYSITNIEWSDKIGETKVTVKKDDDVAILTFNQALLEQKTPNQKQVNAAQNVQPGAPSKSVLLQTPAPPPQLPVSLPPEVQQVMSGQGSTVTQSPPAVAQDLPATKAQGLRRNPGSLPTPRPRRK